MSIVAFDYFDYFVMQSVSIAVLALFLEQHN